MPSTDTDYPFDPLQAFTVDEIAERLKCGDAIIREHIREGKLRSIKLHEKSRTVRVLAEDLLAYLRSL